MTNYVILWLRLVVRIENKLVRWNWWSSTFTLLQAEAGRGAERERGRAGRADGCCCSAAACAACGGSFGGVLRHWLLSVTARGAGWRPPAAGADTVAYSRRIWAKLGGATGRGGEPERCCCAASLRCRSPQLPLSVRATDGREHGASENIDCFCLSVNGNDGCVG